MRRILPISLLFILLTQASAWAEVTIIVRQQAQAPGNYVRICDIARVEGPRELAAAVALTVLGPTPPRGQIREFTRWEIEHRLYEMGLESKILFTGNDVVKVIGNGSAVLWREGDDDMLNASRDLGALQNGAGVASARQTNTVTASTDAETGIQYASPAHAPARTEKSEPAARPGNNLSDLTEDSRAHLIRVISDYLASRYARPDVEIEARLLSLSGSLPIEASTLVVTEALEGRLPGKASLAVRALDNGGKELKTLTVGVDADVYALAPVAVKPMYKGDVISPRNVIVTRVKMKAGVSYLPPDAKAIEGREVQRAIRQGDPILATDAAPSAAVKRGSLVMVDASGQGWRLQASAKALGSGSIDDVIMVEDITNKTKYQARITGPGTVATLVRRTPQGIVQLDQTR